MKITQTHLLSVISGILWLSFLVSSGSVFAAGFSVGDQIWEDLNANGQQDVDEPGLSGLVVTLTGADGMSPAFDLNGILVAPVITENDGKYLFQTLPSGQYSLTIAPPAKGYKLAFSGDDPDNNPADNDNNCFAADGLFQTSTFSLAAVEGQYENLSVDCGFYRPVAVGGRLWVDLDEDGLFTTGEPGLAKAKVTLFNHVGQFAEDIRGNVVKSQLTGDSGEYLFTDLLAGDYVIKVEASQAYELTKTTGEPNDNNLLDNDGVLVAEQEVRSLPITLVWGEEPLNDGDWDAATNLTVSFGFLPVTRPQIPTLATWAIILLSSLMVLGGCNSLHRRGR